MLSAILFAADSILEKTLRGALAGAVIGAIVGPLLWLGLKAQQRWGQKKDNQEPPANS